MSETSYVFQKARNLDHTPSEGSTNSNDSVVDEMLEEIQANEERGRNKIEHLLKAERQRGQGRDLYPLTPGAKKAKKKAKKETTRGGSAGRGRLSFFSNKGKARRSSKVHPSGASSSGTEETGSTLSTDDELRAKGGSGSRQRSQSTSNLFRVHKTAEEALGRRLSRSTTAAGLGLGDSSGKNGKGYHGFGFLNSLERDGERTGLAGALKEMSTDKGGLFGEDLEFEDDEGDEWIAYPDFTWTHGHTLISIFAKIFILIIGKSAYFFDSFYAQGLGINLQQYTYILVAQEIGNVLSTFVAIKVNEMSSNLLQLVFLWILAFSTLMFVVPYGKLLQGYLWASVIILVSLRFIFGAAAGVWRSNLIGMPPLFFFPHSPLPLPLALQLCSTADHSSPSPLLRRGRDLRASFETRKCDLNLGAGVRGRDVDLHWTRVSNLRDRLVVHSRLLWNYLCPSRRPYVLRVPEPQHPRLRSLRPSTTLGGGHSSRQRCQRHRGRNRGRNEQLWQCERGMRQYRHCKERTHEHHSLTQQVGHRHRG